MAYAIKLSSDRTAVGDEVWLAGDSVMDANAARDHIGRVDGLCQNPLSDIHCDHVRMSPLKPAFKLDPVCSAGALRKAMRRISQLYDAELEPSGLKLSQFQIIYHVERLKKPPSMTELARELVIDKSALAHNLKPLERDGLVTQLRDVDDGRTRRVILTADGRSRFLQAKRLWRRAQARFETAYGAECTVALNEALLVVVSDEFATAFES